MQTEVSETWSSLRRIAFRFIFLYLVLYILPFPFNLGFDGVWKSSLYSNFLMFPIHWLGQNIFGINVVSPVFNGSGDTTYKYIQAFIFLVLSITGTILWSLLDRKPQNYNRLNFWLIVYVRYFLGVIMLGYGFAKVIPTQFPFPFETRLLQTVGEMSPMGLLWTFMGYSPAYNFFVGFGEILGGSLLFFRRTTLLGSLILAVVLLNVVMINFSYDVPVKLGSGHLLAMCLFLITPYAFRLWKVVVLHEAVEPMPLQPVFRDSKKGLILLAFKIVVIAAIIALDITGSLSRYRELAKAYSTEGQKIVYHVETFVLRGDTIPPLRNSTVRWNKVLMPGNNQATIEYMDGAATTLPFAADTAQHKITIGSGYTYTFTCSPIDSTKVLWKGLMDKDSLILVVEKKQLHFLLVDRGFHWVNDTPFNR